MSKEENIELVVIAGSAGSFSIILDIVSKLPDKYPIPIVIIIHRGKSNIKSFDTIISNKSNIPFKEIIDKQQIEEGVAYLCPADYHVLVERGNFFSLDNSEKINYSRPSIDLTYYSAAEVYKKKLAAILLSGANEDGADGLKYIYSLGGKTIVQEPKEAQFKRMPSSAIERCSSHLVLNKKEIKEFLLNLLKKNN